MDTNGHLARHRFLNTRICDLNLKVEGLLAACIDKLGRELRYKGLHFRPEYYFGESWGCVNKTISIEIPFHMATPELRHLEKKYRERCENKKELMMTLRHEYGHALNYAYELYRSPKWQKLFGNFDQRYHDLYIPNPYSKRYVKYLEDYYAQKHPDEDWAETFAVWLDRSSGWRSAYFKTPAYEKLEYVDQVIRKIRDTYPIVLRAGRDEPYEEIDYTLAEYYNLNIEELFHDKFAEYVTDLEKIFSPGCRNGRRHKASQFIRRCTPVIVAKIGEWLAGSNKHSIRKYLRRMEAICQHYDFRLSRREMLEKIVEVTTLVNYYVMAEIHNLRE
jgi:hypothetical protein